MHDKRIWASLDPFLEDGPVLGRIQANAGFLQGLLGLDPYGQYRFYPPSEAACRALWAKLRERFPDMAASGRLKVINRLELPEELARTPHHVFHLSDCIVHPGPLAALRNARSGQIFPITSVTHSLSYARYGQDFLRHLAPATTSRDAVVATSQTAVKVVRAFYRFLREGYGLSEADFPEPEVEHIALGVDLARFSPPSEGARAAARAEFGFGGETVFLVLARLCHSSKMDFLPVLRAFHRLILGGTPPGGVRLVLAGWTDEADWGRGTLSDLARNIGLPLTIEERPSEERKLALYAASDVFLSPSDNIQETFGLTLLEAQAMGLPVIASDFDGYRDLVLEGETGLLAPVFGPAGAASVDLMAPMSFDNHTHLILAQRTAVDVAALAAAMGRLAEKRSTRVRMGLAAARFAQGFSWRSVAAEYVELWERLWTRPVADVPAKRHPSAVPYAEVFAAYPTRALGAGMALIQSRLGRAVYRGQDFPIIYEGVAGVVRQDAVKAVLVLARKARDAKELCAKLCEAVPGLDAEAAEAHVLWCLKHDLLERFHG
jgi:glycosyltransferase involved in cell wall biosynthesis